MQAWAWLLEYQFARHALITGVAVASVCSLLGVAVVLKRMAFLGQGVAHAGFGGLGTAMLLGLGGLAQDAVVLAWCLGAALLIGWLARRRGLEPDSAIGVLLAATMAWGVLAEDVSGLLRAFDAYRAFVGPPASRAGFETLLFGSLTAISPTEMVVAVAVAAAVLGVSAALFKELLFFAFDETASRVFGVPAGGLHYLLLALVSLAIVVGIKIAGVILVAALLVLPGATALQLSRRLGRVLVASWAIGVGGTVLGVLTSLELGAVSTGPLIVLYLAALFGIAAGTGRWGRGRTRRGTRGGDTAAKSA